MEQERIWITYPEANENPISYSIRDTQVCRILLFRFRQLEAGVYKPWTTEFDVSQDGYQDHSLQDLQDLCRAKALLHQL